MQSFPKPLTASQESYYLERLRCGDEEAKCILIEKNLRLVAHIAKKYSHFDKDFEELISIGIIGLVKAVNTFKCEKGIRIGTYAARCIDNELLMMLRAKRKRMKEVSLYEPIGTDKEGNEIHLMDVIESTQKEIFEQVELKKDTGRIYQVMADALDERERWILILRYGLGRRRPVTQREIGELLGISRSYVSRIEKKALKKMRDAF